MDLDKTKALRVTLKEAKIDEFQKTLVSLFAGIPYNNYTKNQLSRIEGYWASLVYCYLAGAGIDIIAEDVANTYRIDLTVKIGNNIYIVEFKTANEDALKQIKEKKYYEKYLNENKNIYLIGINFDEKRRNIKEFKSEKIRWINVPKSIKGAGWVWWG